LLLLKGLLKIYKKVYFKAFSDIKLMNKSMQTMFLNMRGVQKSFQEGKKKTEVLKEVSISFEQGQTYAITGVSGTGKSTLLYLLAGLDYPTKGTIAFNDLLFSKMTLTQHEQFLQREVGLLFQQPYLLPELTAFENVMLAAIIAGQKSQDASEKVLYFLDQVGLREKKDSKPSALSGGQQTRLSLARALINQPSFLLADEPTGNLDEKTASAIITLLLKLQKKWRMGLIISTHDMHVARKMNHQYQLQDGCLVMRA
jgi:lipoprotein-releasing system ATP-binding protein